MELQTQKKNPTNIIGKEERNIIFDTLLIKKSNLSVYIRKMKESNILINTAGREYIVNPILIPEFDSDGKATVTFIMEKIEE